VRWWAIIGDWWLQMTIQDNWEFTRVAVKKIVVIKQMIILGMVRANGKSYFLNVGMLPTVHGKSALW